MNLVLKIKNEFDIALGSSINKIYKASQLAVFKFLFENKKTLKTSSLVSNKDQERVEEIIHIHFKKTGKYCSLFHYYSIETKLENTDNLLSTLTGFKEVEFAYINKELALLNTIVNRSQNPEAVNQGYLDPAPKGVGAEIAWQYPGSNGQGISIVDIDFGWNLNHSELLTNGRPVRNLTSNNDATQTDHGTKMLGIIGARDNTKSIVGLAPKANLLVASTTVNNHLLACLFALKAGDVIEIAIGSLGAVTLPYDAFSKQNFDLISMLTSLGVTVVIGAGNSNTDLDKVPITSWGNYTSRLAPNYNDSGAICVGAAEAFFKNGVIEDFSKHKKINASKWGWGSNFGSKVDCYAWGVNVRTISKNPNNDEDSSGTSAASAIIAGVAGIIQGMAIAKFGKPFDTYTLRNIISNAQLGTPSANPAVDRIGVMPDLQKIAETYFEYYRNVTLIYSEKITKTILLPNKRLDLSVCGKVSTYTFGARTYIKEIILTANTKGFINPDFKLKINNTEFTIGWALIIVNNKNYMLNMIHFFKPIGNYLFETRFEIDTSILGVDDLLLNIELETFEKDLNQNSKLVFLTQNLICVALIPDKKYIIDVGNCLRKRGNHKKKPKKKPRSEDPNWGRKKKQKLKT